MSSLHSYLYPLTSLFFGKDNSMVYVSADGTVGGKKSLWKSFTDFLGGIYTLVALFFTTIFNPQALENHSSSSNRTYGNRNQGRSYRSTGNGKPLGRGGANIRGVSQLGDANCKLGG
ncbi:hypothetical protein FisN_9Lu171 [Fistulifera solaris]|uniref:Selenoprotein K n=1 Tax=Fistulifera solaris TaxID=1519565 RepID=A0A1Z5KL68_FISSO|nr:hypothetical protein FisN_9Lu171 [Fistulifera solaris]|eukprot:GAX26875.1 hypothetical protein FisN_9Lu171 [Fistulifera solaris]